MSFGKASDLLNLATMAAARYDGVGLDEIADEFGVSHRTAQRMTDALETLFQCEIRDDDQRRRRWKGCPCRARGIANENHHNGKSAHHLRLPRADGSVHMLVAQKAGGYLGAA
ncbi:hypothetical protein [Paracoccus litorisediminis]|uniref:hypothetical protein n=1 Tax=Paracoccus litorisediminis TaxID=2006130 RepID=UPI001B8B4F0C|nr:hypothetical protein [Paracoccus litorisediminis]